MRRYRFDSAVANRWSLHVKLPTSLQTLPATYQQLGWRRTLITLSMRILRRWFGLYLYRVLVSGVTQVPPMPQLAAGYETRVVTTTPEVAQWINVIQGFNDRLVNEAFSHGDVAAINLFNGALVGYGFTSTARTRVTDQINAFLPPECRYGYAAYTEPKHRNQRLAQARWLARLEATRPPTTEKSVAYIAIDNFASLAMYYQDGTHPTYHGFVGYWRLLGREYPFNSLAARRFGFRFRRAGTPP